MDKIDEKAVQELFEQNLGARAIAKKLGYQNHASVTKCLRRLGLSRSGPCLVEQTSLQYDFAKAWSDHILGGMMLRKAAEHFARFYFTAMAFNVLSPDSMSEYDLMVDFPKEGLKKVQVKSSSYVEESGNYQFALKKTRHNGHETRVVFYTKDECDYFFLLDASMNAWLIPFHLLEGIGTTTPKLRYPGYKIWPIDS